MKEFSVHLQEGKVVRRSPDPVEAQALIAQARERLKDLHTLPLNKQNARFRFEDAYEVLREALQAFLSAEGFKPYSHEAVFSFALERGLLSEGLVKQGDRYRGIRNDITYRATMVTVDETKEAILFVDQALPHLEKGFQKRI